MNDLLLTNLRLATMQPGGAPYGEVPFDAMALHQGRIAWIGASGDAPPAAERVDGGGRWATPGLIDCHTHLVYGGNRAREFEMRLGGAAYEEIGQAGGGILSPRAAERGAGGEE